MKATGELDRLAMRTRPAGAPVMHQNWENLLFLHWPVDPADLRALIPPRLEIDLFDGSAWIGITPFAMSDIRLASLPAIPGLDTLLEVNVRTYVHLDGKPGVWFFSLDASRLIPVIAARVLYGLPYFKADMQFWQGAKEYRFQSRRLNDPLAELQVGWRTGVQLRDPDVHSLAFFLVERYCLFAQIQNSLTMTRIYHHPWILDEASVDLCQSSMISAIGVPEPTGPPLAHFSRFLNVELWEPTVV